MNHGILIVFCTIRHQIHFLSILYHNAVDHRRIGYRGKHSVFALNAEQEIKAFVTLKPERNL